MLPQTPRTWSASLASRLFLPPPPPPQNENPVNVTPWTADGGASEATAKYGGQVASPLGGSERAGSPRHRRTAPVPGLINSIDNPLCTWQRESANRLYRGLTQKKAAALAAGEALFATAPAPVTNSRRLTQEEQDAMVERLAKPLPPFQSPERPQPTIRKYSLTNGKLQVQLAPVPTMGAKEYDTKMSDKYADQVASKQKALDALKDLYYQPLVPKVERSKDYIAKVCAAMYAGNSAKDVQV